MGIAEEHAGLRRLLDLAPPLTSMSDVLTHAGIAHVTAWTGYHLTETGMVDGLDWYFAMRDFRMPINVWQRWWLLDTALMHESQ